MTLSEYLLSRGDFSWEKANCAHFALGWAAPGALDGLRMPARRSELRGALREAGVETLHDFVTSRLGPPIPVATAQRGDVMMYGRVSLGLCDGRWLWLTRAPKGLAAVPALSASAAWRRA